MILFNVRRALRTLMMPMLAAAIVFCSAAGTGIASADPLRELAAYEGDWSLVDPAENRESRMTAINHAIVGLSWVMRKMAGPVLRSSIRPPPRMQFIWDGEHLEQRLVEAKGDRARPIEFGVEQNEGTDTRGEPLSASWAWTDSGLQLNWQQKQANGQNLYRVDSESGFLIVEHTINITAISDVEPIVFESKFGRRHRPAVSANEPSTQARLAP